ncbi:copper resistance CopC/CopD family protein [Halopiger goleimassiliensis]|uniref:copper resistance CopC/CopD family protein n=1 Tax=Halopiger goleimassiliensis TaxID=1293048 RepID=UPI00067796CC|nr:copper resistance protein CopC [Halopiger goleimassiliensis]
MAKLTTCDRGRSTSAPGVAIVLVFGVLVATATLVPVASAHAVLSETDPAQGGHVEEVPETMTMTYTGDGVDEIIDVTVTGPDGEDVTQDAYKEGEVSRDVFVDVADGGDGIYVVEWEVRSTDTHVVQGTWFFTVGDEPSDPAALRAAYESDGGTGDDGLEYAQILPKGVLYAAVIALIGIPTATIGVVRPVAARFGCSSAVPEVAVRRLLAGAAIAALVGTGALYLEAVLGTGRSLEAAGTVGSSRTGGILAAQVAVAAALVVAAVAARRYGADRPTSSGPGLGVRLGGAVSALGGLCLAVGIGATSHAASQVGLLAGTVVTLGHLLGVAVWIGGLAMLGLVLPKLLRHLDSSDPDRRRVAAAAVRRFSVLAIAGVTLLASTGLGLTAWLVPDLEAFVGTVHGTLLGAKLLLVAVALVLGTASRFVLLRRIDSAIDDGGVRPGGRQDRDERESVRSDGGRDDSIASIVRAVRLEIAVVLLVLLLSGALTAAVPGVVAVTTAGDGPDHDSVEIDLGLEGDHEGTLTVLPADRSAGENANGNGSESRGGGDADRAPPVLETAEGTPIVVELALSADGEPIELETEERLLAEHGESDTTIGPVLEPLEEPGRYGVVLILPESGEWTVRLNVWTGETFIDDEFRLSNAPADEDTGGGESGTETAGTGDGHVDHDHDDAEAGPSRAEPSSPFAAVLQFGAIAVAIVGSVAVVVETVRLGDRESA